MRRFAHLPLLGAIAVFGLVACSSDSKSSGTSANPITSEGGAGTDDTVTDDTTDDTTSDTITDETVTDETVTEVTVDPDLEGSGVGTPFCDINTSLNESDVPLDSSSPDDIQAYYESELPDLLDQLVDATPPELEDDVDILIEGVEKFGEVLADNDWDIEAAFADPALGELIGSEEFNLAGQRVDAYCAEG